MNGTYKRSRSSGAIPICVVLLMLATATSAWGQSYTYSVDPKATYLATYNDPQAVPAVPIVLSSIGVEPGQRISLSASGSVAYGPGWPLQSPSLLGMFSSDTGPTALPSGKKAVTGQTYYGSEKTDVRQDFRIPQEPDSYAVIVPPEAVYLFVALADSYYSDNNSSTLAVTITLGSVDLQLGVALESALTVPASAVVAVQQGATVTYAFRITNNGPDPAPKVNLAVPIPKGATPVSASIEDAANHSGTCETKPEAVICEISGLERFADASARVSFQVENLGVIRPVGSVSSLAFDPDRSNNTALPPTVVVTQPPKRGGSR